MKKVILVLASVFVVTGVLAKDINDLTLQELQKYNRCRLAVEPIRIKPSLWIPYQGNIQITEIEFYEIAGFHDDAKKAADHYKESDIRIGWGLFLAAIGLIDVTVIPILTAAAIIPEVAGYIALGVAPVIIIAMLIIQSEIKPVNNWSPVSYAQDAADAYNQQLLESFE